MIIAKRTTRLLILGLITVAAAIYSAQFSEWLRVLAIFPLVIFTPGYLLLGLVDKLKKTLPIKIVFSVGLGLTILIIEGLFINWSLPLLKISQTPLDRNCLVLTYSVTLTVLTLLSLFRERGTGKTKTLNINIQFRDTCFQILPLLIPITAAIGAERLNNNSGGGFAILSLCLIIVLSAFYMLKSKLISPWWLLFNIGLGLLLSTSLRSSYVSGFDISQEFQAFSVTLNKQHWSMSNLAGDIYNACLSLTILPAFIHSLTNISATYVFKVCYQIIFGLIGVIVYLIANLFTPKKWSFLVAFFFLAQAQFIDEMPALARQEIALLFFGLVVYAILSQFKKARNSRALLFIFSISLILSHYSTAYLTFALLALTYLLTKIYGHIIQPKGINITTRQSSAISGSFVFIFLLITLLWYSQINLASGNIVSTFSKSISNIGSTFSPQSRSSVVQSTFLGGTSQTPQQTLNSYESTDHINSQTVGAPPNSILPIKNSSAYSVVSAYRSLFIDLLRIFTIIGLLYILFSVRFRDKKTLGYLCLSGTLITLLIVAVPSLSIDYNLERLYQQMLIFLGIAIVYGGAMCLPKLTNKTKLLIATLLVFSQFIFSPGAALAEQISGGENARMTMNNSGDDFDKFFVHDSEQKAAEWTATNCRASNIYADRYASLRIIEFSNIQQKYINQNILSSGQKGCLMLSYTNSQMDIGYASLNNGEVPYTFNPDQLANNKNTVYSNGEEKIYYAND